MRKRQCAKCSERKDISLFRPIRKKLTKSYGEVTYLDCYCKPCRYEVNKASRKRSPESIERIRAYQKEYFKTYNRVRKD